MEGGGDQRIPPEAEDHAGRVDRAYAAEAGPPGIEGQTRKVQLPGDPDADGEGENDPDHGEDDADLARIVVVVRQPVLAGLRREVAGDHHEDHPDAGCRHEHAMNADRIITPGHCHHEANNRHGK